MKKQQPVQNSLLAFFKKGGATQTSELDEDTHSNIEERTTRPQSKVSLEKNNNKKKSYVQALILSSGKV